MWKAIVKSNPYTRRLAIAIRSQLRLTTEDKLRKLVREAASLVNRPVFVKVGANDGVMGDPFGDSLLLNRQWTGLLVEPVPYCFDRLKAIYFDELRFTLEQCAVGRNKGNTQFFYVSDSAKDSLPDLPPWYDQLGSFDRQHIVKHLDGKIEPFIVTHDVKVEPLDTILRRHQLDNITLLHVDTEGYDLEVLKSLGLPELRPSWILIEHKHLSDDDRSEMISMLDSSGYDICDIGSDFFAMNREANNELHRSGRVGRHFNGEFLTPAR